MRTAVLRYVPRAFSAATLEDVLRPLLCAFATPTLRVVLGWAVLRYGPCAFSATTLEARLAICPVRLASANLASGLTTSGFAIRVARLLGGSFRIGDVVHGSTPWALREVAFPGPSSNFQTS